MKKWLLLSCVTFGMAVSLAQQEVVAKAVTATEASCPTNGIVHLKVNQILNSKNADGTDSVEIKSLPVIDWDLNKGTRYLLDVIRGYTVQPGPVDIKRAEFDELNVNYFGEPAKVTVRFEDVNDRKLKDELHLNTGTVGGFFNIGELTDVAIPGFELKVRDRLRGKIGEYGKIVFLKYAKAPQSVVVGNEVKTEVNTPSKVSEPSNSKVATDAVNTTTVESKMVEIKRVGSLSTIDVGLVDQGKKAVGADKESAANTPDKLTREEGTKNFGDSSKKKEEVYAKTNQIEKSVPGTPATDNEKRNSTSTEGTSQSKPGESQANIKDNLKSDNSNQSVPNPSAAQVTTSKDSSSKKDDGKATADLNNKQNGPLTAKPAKKESSITARTQTIHLIGIDNHSHQLFNKTATVSNNELQNMLNDNIEFYGYNWQHTNYDERTNTFTLHYLPKKVTFKVVNIDENGKKISSRAITVDFATDLTVSPTTIDGYGALDQEKTIKVDNLLPEVIQFHYQKDRSDGAHSDNSVVTTAKKDSEEPDSAKKFDSSQASQDSDTKTHSLADKEGQSKLPQTGEATVGKSAIIGWLLLIGLAGQKILKRARQL